MPSTQSLPRKTFAVFAAASTLTLGTLIFNAQQSPARADAVQHQSCNAYADDAHVSGPNRIDGQGSAVGKPEGIVNVGVTVHDNQIKSVFARTQLLKIDEQSGTVDVVAIASETVNRSAADRLSDNPAPLEAAAFVRFTGSVQDKQFRYLVRVNAICDFYDGERMTDLDTSDVPLHSFIG